MVALGNIVGNVLSLESFLLVFLYVVVSGPAAHGITRTYTGLSGMPQEIAHGFVLVILFLICLTLLPTSPQSIGTTKNSSGTDVGVLNFNNMWA